MKEVKLKIPDEKLELFEFTRNDLPGVACVNTALTNDAVKDIFVWHLSININFESLVENGMPSIDEIKVVDKFGDELHHFICGEIEKPNALFLARVTWNAKRKLMFRVYEPKAVNLYLQELISRKDYPREFDYRMEEDFEWEKADFYLNLS